MNKENGKSALYASELALVIDSFREDGGMFLGLADLDVCSEALRSHASRHRRRASLTIVSAIFVFATFGLGLPDLDHDGRVGISDLAYAARGQLGSQRRPLGPRRSARIEEERIRQAA